MAATGTDGLTRQQRYRQRQREAAAEPRPVKRLCVGCGRLHPRDRDHFALVASALDPGGPRWSDLCLDCR